MFSKEQLNRSIPHDQLLIEMTSFNKTITLIGIIIPMLVTICTFFGMFLTKSFWPSTIDIFIFLTMYSLVGFGVTVGFHRLLTHGSFQTYNIFRYILGVLGTMSAQGSILTWVADHRKHHKFTDKDGDPHTPYISCGNDILTIIEGLYHAHMGWLLEEREISDWRIYANDLYNDTGMRFISRNSGKIVIMGLIIPMLLGWYLSGAIYGAFTGLLWGGIIRIFIFHHVTWSINSICHFYGSREFETFDKSTNVFWLIIPSLGESWHNNHHAFPRSAMHGIRKWQIDISYFVISVLEKIGLAWNVVRFEEEIKRRKKEF